MNNSYNWYLQLIKPFWAPPSWLFGPVWSVLYVLIAVSFGRVFILGWLREIPLVVVLPFVLNLVANAAFTPLQFGVKNNLFAAIDILLVLTTLIWALWAIYPHERWITLINIPYLLWVSFATILQLTITFLNR